MITAAEISEIIENEIAGDWAISNAHGVDLKACLADPPEKQVFVDASDNSQVDLWLVLEEDPETRSGYKIVFDESTNDFGLATPSWEGPNMYLGSYGTFLDALESM